MDLRNKKCGVVASVDLQAIIEASALSMPNSVGRSPRVAAARRLSVVDADLTVAAAADVTGTALSTIYAAVSRGDLLAYRIGAGRVRGALRIRHVDLDAFRSRNAVAPVAERPAAPTKVRQSAAHRAAVAELDRLLNGKGTVH